MTIQEIKELVNRVIVENYTGDITAEDVNRILNETLDHVNGNEAKVTSLVQKFSDFSINTNTGVLTYRGKKYQLIALQDITSAVVGEAICGFAICGNN